MKDYTSLYPGLTPRDAAIVYMHALHDRYMRRKPGVYDCGRPESERENGCAGCRMIFCCFPILFAAAGLCQAHRQRWR